jgi:hypothetical protein
MEAPRVRDGVVLAIALLLALPDRAHPAPRPSPSSAFQEREETAVPIQLPLAFVENRGQWSPEARFGAAARGAALRLEAGALAIRVRGSGGEGEVREVALRLGFEGARPGVALEGEGRLPGVHSFFLGSDPGRWRQGLAGHASVLFQGLYEGIDLRVRGTPRALEYDLLLRPGADPSRIVIRYEGAEGLSLEPDGSLRLATAAGDLRQRIPACWEESPSGGRTPLEARFRPIDGLRCGFEIPGWRGVAPLVIDPGIEWGTLLGGGNYDRAAAVAVAPDGSTIVVGESLSPDFPTTPGALDSTYNGSAPLPSPFGDAVVSRLLPDGSGIVYSTYLGGTENDVGRTVALNSAGEALVSGWTGSPDFPTTAGSYDTTFNGLGPGTNSGGDLFVVRLGASGTSLVYSTFVGGSDLEYTVSMALTPAGEPTVAGHVHSTDFPVTPGAYDTSFTLFSEAFVTRLNSAGTALVFSSFIGGGEEEYPYAMDVAPNGETTIGGGTDSSDFPVTPGALDTTYNGGPAHLAEAFLTRFSADGSGLLFSTFLGSPGDEVAFALEVSASGSTTATGQTNSPLFPTTPGAIGTTHAGLYDVFVTRLASTGATLVASTLLGGAGDEVGEGISLDASGAPTVVGRTGSTGFPVTAGAYATVHGASDDAFVARLSAPASVLYYASFLEGNSWESAHGVEIAGSGSATVVGETFAFDFPTTPGAFDTTNGGSADAFVLRTDLLPVGASRYGTSTPGCAGALAIGVTAIPQVGNGGFGLTCVGAPPSASGLLGISGAALPAPIGVSGAAVWIQPAALLVLLATSDGAGGAVLPIPIPPSAALAGGQVFSQFAWPDACAPGGLSASNALQVVVQP